MVDKLNLLKHLSRLFHPSMMTTGGSDANKAELKRKLLDYIERNRTLVESLFQMLVQLDLPFGITCSRDCLKSITSSTC